MNCEDVFAILTRGPFPTGASNDWMVEEHLRGCAGCRRLANALRPAEELEEAVIPEESRDLPGYWGASLESERPERPPRAARRCKRGPAVGWRRPAWGRLATSRRYELARVAVALVIGAVAGSALRGIGQEDRPQTVSGIPAFTAPMVSAPDAPEPRVFTSRQGLFTLGLAAACLSTSPGGAGEEPAGETLLPAEILLKLDEHNLNCCTQCHAPGGTAVASRQATIKVAQSCQLCHFE